VVHRALKAALGERHLAGYAEALATRGMELGEHVSARERAAMDGERDVSARTKALFLSKRIGETFPAAIASVSRHGFFAELEAFPIEGYVPAATLRDDVYRFSAEREEWYGTVRKKRLAPADRILVRLFRADVDRGEIDFLFVEKPPESRSSFTGAGHHDPLLFFWPKSTLHPSLPIKKNLSTDSSSRCELLICQQGGTGICTKNLYGIKQKAIGSTTSLIQGLPFFIQGHQEIKQKMWCSIKRPVSSGSESQIPKKKPGMPRSFIRMRKRWQVVRAGGFPALKSY